MQNETPAMSYRMAVTICNPKKNQASFVLGIPHQVLRVLFSRTSCIQYVQHFDCITNQRKKANYLATRHSDGHAEQDLYSDGLANEKALLPHVDSLYR